MADDRLEWLRSDGYGWAADMIEEFDRQKALEFDGLLGLARHSDFRADPKERLRFKAMWTSWALRHVPEYEPGMPVSGLERLLSDELRRLFDALRENDTAPYKYYNRFRNAMLGWL